MNKRNVIYIFLIFAASVVAVITVRTATTASRTGSLSLELSTEKRNYELGEKVPIEIILSNGTNQTHSIASPSVASGSVRLFISTDGSNFIKYSGPGWGTIEGVNRPTKLEPGNQMVSKTAVLYNERHTFGPKNEMYAERFRRNDLGRHVAFVHSGKYWLKATYDDGRTKIESTVLELEFSEPSGPDSLVWQRVRDQSEYAYFVHTGEVKFFPKTPEHASFIEDIRGLRDELGGTAFAQKVDHFLAEKLAIEENLRNIATSR